MPSEGESAFAALPAAFLVSVAERLPVDSRLLAAGVNRHWRAALASPRVWDDLDLSFEGGATPLLRLRDLSCGKSPDTLELAHLQSWLAVSVALLRAAARRAPRRLAVQDVLLHDAEAMQLLRAPSLRELHVQGDELRHDGVTALLSALPALPRLSVDLVNDLTLLEAAQFLEGAAREPRLRLHDLWISTPFAGNSDVPLYVSPQMQQAVAAAIVAYPWPLRTLKLAVCEDEATAGCLGRLVEAARQARVPTLHLFGGGDDLDAAGQATLRALLHDGHVQELAMWGSGGLREGDAPPETQQLAVALRASTALRTLRLVSMTFALDTDGYVSIMEALTGHPSLASLELQQVPLFGDDLATTRRGAALAALVGADTPALRVLHLEQCAFNAVNLTALLCALRRNRHLRELRCIVSLRGTLTLEQACAFAAALATNNTLEVLELPLISNLPEADGEVSPMVVLLASLVAHPSMRALKIRASRAVTPRAALGIGACLHALVAADAPALKALDARCLGLRREGLSLQLRALPRNTHLETLDCSFNAVELTDLDEAFARDVLLPAVRANASLARLKCSEVLPGAPVAVPPHVQGGFLHAGSGPTLLPSCVEAMRLVDRRPLWQ